MSAGVLSLLMKPLRQLTAAEIGLIATSGVLEDAQTEFKEAVSDKGKRGGGAGPGKWDASAQLDEKARDRLLAEIVAFANTFGGTLYIGIEETDTDPKRSKALKPVPHVAKLAAILENMLRDCIEPRLLAPEIVPIITAEGTGAGVLAVRVNASPTAPHWNSSERKSYRRIGTITQSIGMLDLQSITLERARTGAEIERLFEERRRAFERTWDAYRAARADELHIVNWTSELAIPPGYGVRCTAVPSVPIKPINVTSRDDLRIGIDPVLLKTSDKTSLSFLGYTETSLFRPELRAWTYDHGWYGNNYRHRHLVSGDGVLEGVLMCIPNLDQKSDLPVEFLLTMAFGMIFAVERFRSRTGLEGVPYEVELEVRLRGEASVLYYFGRPQPGIMRMQPKTLFPRYLVEGRGQVEGLIEGMQHDMWNAMGRLIDGQHIQRLELDLPMMWQVIDGQVVQS